MSNTIEDIEKFSELYSKISIEAEALLRKINAIRPIEGYDYLYIESIDDETIEFTGTETWAYGGYENYNYGFPINLLYDEQALEDYFEGLHKKNEADRLKEEKIEEGKKKKDLAEFKRLKEKLDK